MCSLARRTRARKCSGGFLVERFERQRSGGIHARAARAASLQIARSAAHGLAASPFSEIAYTRVGARRRGRPGARRAARTPNSGARRGGSCSAGLDFRRQLIAEIHDPAADERQRLSAPRARRLASRRYQASRLSRNPPATRLDALSPSASPCASRHQRWRGARRPACCSAPAGPARRCPATRDTARVRSPRAYAAPRPARGRC